MNDIIQVVDKVLSQDVSSEEGLNQIELTLREANVTYGKYSKFSCAYRLCRALSEVHNGQSSWLDVAGNLRQLILNCKRKLNINREYASEIEKIAADFGLHINSDNEITALGYYPDWMGDSDQILEVHNFKPRWKKNSVLGDGFLFQMTGHTHYISHSQKAAVRLAMNLAPGHTLLACLPTGGGKSLVGLMPAWYQTKGGTLSGAIEGAGSTIVVVPTVALALDQAITAQRYFREAASKDHMPAAYWGGMPDDDKKLIYEGLQKGTMPLVYISPEAILNGPLAETLLDAAGRGRINTLIIDEAHITVDWGGSFRPDFQFMAPFRKKLLAASGGRLRTILMSATMSDWTTGILKELFTEQEKLVEVRGDALRPEPMLWLNCFSSEEERREKTLQVLPLLPRPIILYVTNPKKAVEWRNLIRECGYASVAVFTGETTRGSREELLKRWNEDQLDIMVATSAFGMGVDKPDIRTIIHCCLPESMDRYYQEVGRSGRDGFASICIMNMVPAIDYDESFNLIKSRVLTTENMADRWLSMRRKPVGVLEGDLFWADTGCKPPHLEEKITGQRNAGYNENALLFYYRNQLLDIFKVQSGKREEKRQVQVRMLDLEALNDKTVLLAKLEPLREKEWQYVNSEYHKIKKLYSNSVSKCISHFLTETYSHTEPLCGGCPYCRLKRYPVDNIKESVTIKQGEQDQMFRGVPSGLLGEKMFGSREVLITTQDIETITMARLSGNLIHFGVANLILPSLDSGEIPGWLGEMPYEYCGLYTVFELPELTGDMGSISGFAAVIYPKDEKSADDVFRWTRQYLAAHPENRIVHLAPADLIIRSSDKELAELVDGGVYSAAPWLEALERSNEIDFL